MSNYQPQPIQFSEGLELSFEPTIEAIAEKIHDSWAAEKIRNGWSFGEEQNATAKTHPSLVPYSELPEDQKELDRVTAKTTLAALIELGYSLERES